MLHIFPQGYVNSLTSDTDDHLEERCREGRDAVPLLECVHRGGSAADGGGKRRQQHSSTGGVLGGREQVTGRRIAAVCAHDIRSTHGTAELAQPTPGLRL